MQTLRVRDDLLLIKSTFVETTRKGEHLCSVVIALTSKSLLITSSHNQLNDLSEDESAKLISYYPLETTKLEVFKNSQRQSIKVSFNTKVTKYYELGQWKKRKIFWKLWCIHVGELNSQRKIWPFVDFQHQGHQFKDRTVKKKKLLSWTDKYLYLGTKRAIEDNDRPKPVPGLGPAEDIKLLYLKPKYFGCWDQSEHWVQCGNSSADSD